MDFVLDTNILVYFIRSDKHIQQLEKEFPLFSPENAAFISIVSVGEIRSLAYQFGWGKGKIKRMNIFLQALNPFPIDTDELTAAYAEVDAYSKGQHPSMKLPKKTTSRKMGKNDLWIAASAYIFNATLLTTDNDFSHLSSIMKIKNVAFPLI
ncbi:MAG: type II toxin-antitoxin system VapC family toxin [Saprospiraceae bacterium]